MTYEIQQLMCGINGYIQFSPKLICKQICCLIKIMKYKINFKNTKIILKETFNDLIPEELLHAKKSGFGVPIGKWFQNELKENF